MYSIEAKGPISGSLRIVILGKKEISETDGEILSAERLGQLLQVENQVVQLQQVHGTRKVEASRILNGEEVVGDAIYSRKGSEVLVVRTADCVPVFFWSDELSIHGVVHSGWKGSLAGILENTLLSLGAENQVSNWNLLVGPHARSCHYRVREDVQKKFAEEFPDCLQWRESGQWGLDLSSFLQYRLRKNGIGHRWMEIPDCTMEENEWFSHRLGNSARNYNCILYS